jgi:superfamily I DNA/RNA helicase
MKRHENLLIKAYAGTGKTTTIVAAVELLPKDKSIMFLAFNRHIKKEFEKKLPEHVRCYTTYGLGMSAIKRKYGDSIVFEEFKIDKIIQKKAKGWKIDEEFEDEKKKLDYMKMLKKMVNLCRLTLTLKPDFIAYLASRHDITINPKRDVKRILKILDTATNDRKTFDYTDMIYLPAVDNSIWMFQQDYVFVDEVQDLNRCQTRIIEKILKKERSTGKLKGRLISVGDAFQGIYGFTGADEKSFQWFADFPNTKVLPLSVSFRCSQNVIKAAQEIVPDIKALDSAPDGTVRDGSVLEEANNGDFVLCRTTMPLVKLFFEFLTKHKKAVINGSEVGVQLSELIGKINSIKDLTEHWNRELINYRRTLKNSGILTPHEHSGYAALLDQVNTLLFLSQFANSIPDLKVKIATIFTDKIEGICLSTIHKIKGLEANRVFIVRPDLLPLPNTRGWQYAQEKNLEYVAITRSRTDLIYDREWTDESE